MVENVPAADEFSIPGCGGASRVADLLENFAPGGGRAAAAPSRSAGSSRRSRRTGVEAAPRARSQPGPAGGGGLGGPERPETLDDYAALFRTIEPPAIVETFQDDRVFGQRVAGANPSPSARSPRWTTASGHGGDLLVVRPDDHLEARLRRAGSTG
jgi:hypothetical protein